MSRRARNISAEALESAVAAYLSGVNVSEICEEYDIPINRFYEELKAVGIRRERHTKKAFHKLTRIEQDSGSPVSDKKASPTGTLRNYETEKIKERTVEIVGRAENLDNLTDEELLAIIRHRPEGVPLTTITPANQLKIAIYHEALGWTAEHTALKIGIRVGTVKKYIADSHLIRNRLGPKLWLLKDGMLQQLVQRLGPQGACIEASIALPDLEILLSSVDIDRTKRGEDVVRKLTADDIARDWRLKKAARRELQLRYEQDSILRAEEAEPGSTGGRGKLTDVLRAALEGSDEGEGEA